MRFFLLALVLATAASADTASTLFKQGLRAEKQGKDLEAFALVARASGMKPQQPKYRAEMERLRLRAAQSLASMGKFDEAAGLDPDNAYFQARLNAQIADEDTGAGEDQQEPLEPPTAAEIQRAEMARGPIRIKAALERHNFDLSGTSRTLYEKIFQAYGIAVVFDPDFPTGATIRFRLDNAGFVDAVRALMALTSTFVAPLNETMMLVVTDNQQKRAELEPVMAVLIPLPQAISIEEANEVAHAVQQALDIRRLAVDTARRLVYVRDTVSRVFLAQALYEQLARHPGEVMIDIELVSTSHSDLTNLGAILPNSFPITYLGVAPNTPPVSSVQDNLTLPGRRRQSSTNTPVPPRNTLPTTRFGLQIADSAVEADWSRSHAQLLSSFRLRSTDGLPATMHIGDKYPIVNTTFSPILQTSQISQLQQAGQYQQPFPSITFEDLGLQLKVTPKVHDGREVSLTIEAEFKLLTGASQNGVPVISSRKFSSSVRLSEGQSSLVFGLAEMKKSRTTGGIFGLGNIPFLGRLFRKDSWQTDQDELLLSITPRILSLPPGEQGPQHAYFSGTESRMVPPI